MDDIIVTGSNPSHDSELVLQLGNEFAMIDLGLLHFFLGIEVKYFEGGIHLSQSKYVVELLAKIEMTLAKAVATPLAQEHGLREAVGSLIDASLCRMIVESLQYLTLTRPDITHVVNLASQFMQSPNIEHLQGVKRSLRYIKVNPVMHARTKHVEMNYHFVREKMAKGQLLTQFVRFKEQLADIHTKALTKQVFSGFRNKLGVIVPPLTSLRGSVEGSLKTDGTCRRNRSIEAG
ncbi:uncharacterized mitochondrial protein AtMg00810-like [Solanum tuberosum]|uniref:uncharacterized mitochondrial protein AtMg00810-like n=1 Tax=Solanum tuberosum TaxID=4113 RepID=UPI00073A2A45|nr:PREDICTED: uncharacterized mitochondrial protein AtMg00810-like [Solanum tuberosum]